jgi:hypothetical protein
MIDMTEDKRIEACAQAAHEANRVYCIAIGDMSQDTWSQAPQWQRDSAREGVKGVIAGNGPEQSHESWLKQKKADGWKYGPVKDPDKKEHPCFVRYAELPPEQKKKDNIFVETVRSVYWALGGTLDDNYGDPPPMWNLVDEIRKEALAVDLFASGFAREILREHWRSAGFNVKDPNSFAPQDAEKAYAWAADMLEARRAIFAKTGIEDD